MGILLYINFKSSILLKMLIIWEGRLITSNIKKIWRFHVHTFSCNKKRVLNFLPNYNSCPIGYVLMKTETKENEETFSTEARP